MAPAAALHRGRMCKAFCVLSSSGYYIGISYTVLLGSRFPIQTVHLLPMPSSVLVLAWKPAVEKVNYSSLIN